MSSPRHLSVFLLLLHFFFSCSSSIAAAAELPSLPLSTQSRWIVDNGGRRVKLACACWAGHLEPAFPEGLSLQPLDAISKRLVGMGFNCVRLTWALRLLTDGSLSSRTVRQSLTRYGLVDAVFGVIANNPELIDVTVVQAYQAVVANLASNNIMVILDNHITTPTWCCSKDDGNGFFGDRNFDPDEWLHGLEMMATMFNGTSNVVGMSLRNELRGYNENSVDWFGYMRKGAEVVHAANPNVLVILSGLNFDLDLSFVDVGTLHLSFQGKLVFEIHRYAFSISKDWEGGNRNAICGDLLGSLMSSGFFLLDQGLPLLLSEFGGDQNGGNIADNRFLTCILSLIADYDVDWVVWAFHGSYYYREGQPQVEETYGMLTANWSAVRNPSFIARVAPLQSPLQGPGLQIQDPYSVLFHPLTGLCAVVKNGTNELALGSCADSDEWIYTPQLNLMIKDKGQCLSADVVGQAASVGTDCSDSSTRWQPISASGLHIASRVLSSGDTPICLEASADGSIVTNPCICINNEDGSCSPESQWFKIVSRKES